MKRQLAFIGFGELGRQLVWLLSEEQRLEEFTYFDDVLYEKSIENAFPFSDWPKNKSSDFDFIIGLGYKHLLLKEEIVNKLVSSVYSLPSLIHPTAFVNSNSEIGHGVYVYPMCNIDLGVKIGQGTLLNNSVVVSHDSHIGNCCYLSPGVIVSGNVSIGNATFIGSGSIISNGVKIGSNVQIGIGSVITGDVPDNTTVIGNPQRFVSRRFNF